MSLAALPPLRTPVRRALRLRGFTLIEVLIVVAILGILSAIALPSYERYVKKSRARGASADLVALASVLENRFQKTLSYPTHTALDPIGHADFGAWRPAQGQHFSYAVTSTASGYALTATARQAAWSCALTLNQSNQRNAASTCPVLGAW